MTSQNPYAPPSTLPASPEDPRPDIAVDGKLLVVATGVELPRRCIKTNKPMTEKHRLERRFTWNGKAFRLTLAPKQCDIVLYANHSYRWLGALRIAASSVLVLYLVVAIVTDFLSPSLFPVVIGASLLVTTIIDRRLLRVTHYKDDRFWIKGCGNAFLESLQRELNLREEA